ncbi:Transcription elongation factor TFIIS [Gracilariopsis chorda]|uniref:Transcription elongation factor TFIIS n=1 Tax=Gracilariopsis chorda TaxID=448386 RepID=A0A2V3J6V5_9FLOR|nr:Transcription elongation factor TFIIS [Gracilariopsis chorda]|eukprot:PXF50158.1 Transcription elongation factor TFIIS [Gracilariopsis chorda]
MADVKKKLSATKTIDKKTRPPTTPKILSSAHPPHTPPLDVSPSTVSVPPPPDHDSQYDVKHPTGDKMRDKVRSLLADALFKKDEKHVSSKDDAQLVANAIEHAMFIKFDGNGQSYKQKYRSISFNLKDPKNGKLRSLVLTRQINPQELLDMSSTELANDELRKRRAEVQEKMTRDAMPYTQQAASTDRFKCGKCKQRKCTYYQMQTRSADEPLTTFVTCVNCNNRWRF